MAWYLLCAGGSGATAPIVTIPDWIPSNQSNWACRLKFKTGTDVTTDRTILGREQSTAAATDATHGFKFSISTGNLRCLYVRYWNTTNWLTTPISANTEYDLLYKVTSTGFELWDNVTSTLITSKTLPNRAAAGTAMAQTVVGRNVTTNTTFNNSVTGSIYYNVDFIDYDDAANSRYYDASLSGGTGASFPTTTNTNNGTQAGTWPTDDSEWVFYSSGATYQLTALGGTFTYSGQTAALNRGFKLAAQGGAYIYTGASANLSYTTATIYRLDALGASYSYAGASASLLRGFVLDAQGGAYSYVGSSTSLLRGFKLAANGGAYSYAGGDAALTKSGPMVYRLTALGVTYIYSGATATLTATGVIPAANPAAFVNRAYVGGSQVISAQVGGRMVNNAKIGGILTNNAMVAI